MALFWLLLVLLLIPSAAHGQEPEFVDVFSPQLDGFPSIRIPAVLTTANGLVLTFAEGRAADADQAHNRIVMKRSRDGGKTWDALAIVATDGDRALNNPCVLQDRNTDRILLLYQSYPANASERSGKIQPGFAGDAIVRNMLVTSDNDGDSWSTPRDLTRETKREQLVTTVAGGPGLGIQLRHGAHAGRMLFPMNEGPFGRWNIYAIYSDDAGETWTKGEVAPGASTDGGQRGAVSMVNEAQFVELNDGSILFNVRRWAGKPVRKTSLSSDGGISWSKVEDAPELRDPGCMGSIFRYSDIADRRKSRILYSGPQSDERKIGTVLLSYDEGRTWPMRRTICPGAFAYSCLTALPDGTIGCLCEVDDAHRIVFVRFSLQWLTAGQDRWE